MALRFALWSQTGLDDPYDLAVLCTLPVPDGMKERFRSTSHDKRTTVLGLRQVAEILQHLGDPVAGRYFRNNALRQAITIRNNLTHKVRAVAPQEAASAVAAAREFISLLPMPQIPSRPATL